jgi:hypothetical protein
MPLFNKECRQGLSGCGNSLCFFLARLQLKFKIVALVDSKYACFHPSVSKEG